MAHLKRQKAPKNWSIPRKGKAFIVTPNSNPNTGVPILVVLRDMLKVAENRKEVKKALYAKNILINNRAVRDEKNAAVLFDVITIIPSKKHYRIVLSERGKFEAEEIKEKEANNKVAKIIDKKVLKGKKTQLNLSDGRNFLSEIKCNVNDSVLIDLTKKKIEKCLVLKEKANIVIFAGKHAGEKGEVNKVIEDRKIVEATVNQKKINVLIKQIIVTE